MDTCTANEVFCRNVKFWNTASRMRNSEALGASDGGGSTGPGGGHMATVGRMSNGIVVMI